MRSGSPAARFQHVPHVLHASRVSTAAVLELRRARIVAGKTIDVLQVGVDLGSCGLLARLDRHLPALVDALPNEMASLSQYSLMCADCSLSPPLLALDVLLVTDSNHRVSAGCFMLPNLCFKRGSVRLLQKLSRGISSAENEIVVLHLVSGQPGLDASAIDAMDVVCICKMCIGKGVGMACELVFGSAVVRLVHVLVDDVELLRADQEVAFDAEWGATMEIAREHDSLVSATFCPILALDCLSITSKPLARAASSS